MDAHQVILKRVGIVLILVGILDIGYMAYCIANEKGYSSSFNVFSIVAGVFLLRGNLKAVRFISWYVAFIAGAALASMVLFPLVRPMGLWFTELRLYFWNVTLGIVVGIAGLMLLLWVYKQLRSAAVVEARVAAGHPASAPTGAFLMGLALGAGLAVFALFAERSEDGATAKALAREKHGASYEYQVARIRWSGNRVWANLTAYNDREIRQVQVEWEK